MSSTYNNRPLYTARPPPGFRRKLWDWSTTFEVTFALSMMQPWEKAVIWTTLALITLLFWFSLYSYLPAHVTYLQRRYAYYVYGDENVELDWFIGRVKDLVETQMSRGAGEVQKGMGMAGGHSLEL
ncbi:hypothetical protein B9479_004974 [Cryptococcus floricola]|uniref:Uncharacterized protein n=1 Tax=Cryptococcus floricola TaxID=2591691 RepID=A0A5D3AWZ6_9TREE|nr:hypothetical protein B9479_004974 [Cryptococcus floricola]